MATLGYNTTRLVIELLGKRKCPWGQDWQEVPPQNPSTGELYAGWNALLLSAVGGGPFWLTADEIRSLGGRVRRGERGVPLLDRPGPVYSLERCGAPPLVSLSSRLQTPIPCDSVLASYHGAPAICHRPSSAFYDPIKDTIHVCPPCAFPTPSAYWSTLFLQLVSSTAHPKRLARYRTPMRLLAFGLDPELLTVSIGRALLCREAGISVGCCTPGYEYWMTGLQRSPGAILRAARAAEEAVRFVLGRELGEAVA